MQTSTDEDRAPHFASQSAGALHSLRILSSTIVQLLARILLIMAKVGMNLFDLK